MRENFFWVAMARAAVGHRPRKLRAVCMVLFFLGWRWWRWWRWCGGCRHRPRKLGPYCACMAYCLVRKASLPYTSIARRLREANTNGSLRLQRTQRTRSSMASGWMMSTWRSCPSHTTNLPSRATWIRWYRRVAGTTSHCRFRGNQDYPADHAPLRQLEREAGRFLGEEGVVNPMTSP